MSSAVRKDETGNEQPKRTSITVLVLGDGKFNGVTIATFRLMTRAG